MTLWIFDCLFRLSPKASRVLVAAGLIMSGAIVHSASHAALVEGDDACDVSYHSVRATPTNRMSGTSLAQIMVGGFGAHLETEAERADRAARRANRARKRAARKAALQADHDPDQEMVD